MALPHKNITKIPNTEPDAVPSLWNNTYAEIDANFEHIDSKLATTNNSAANIDPMFEDASLWGTDQFPVKQIADGAVGPNVWYGNTASNNRLNNANKFVIDASKTYLFEVWYRALAETDGRAFAVARFFDASGAVITKECTGWPGSNSGLGNHYWPNTGTVTTTEWKRYTVTVGPNGTAKFPVGAVACALGTYMNYLATTPVEIQCNMLRVTEMVRSELLLDGSVGRAALADDAFSVDKIVPVDLTNRLPGGGFDCETDLKSFSTSAASYFSIDTATTAGSSGALKVKAATGNTSLNARKFEVSPGERFLITFKSKATNDYNGTGNNGKLRIGDKDDALLGAVAWPSATSFTRTRYEYMVPAGVTRLTVRLVFDHTVGTLWVDDLALRRMGADELIADGTLTEPKLAPNSVTEQKLAVDSVVGAKVKNKTLTNDKLVIGSAENLLADPQFNSGWTGWADSSKWCGFATVTGPDGDDIKVLRATPITNDQAVTNASWPIFSRAELIRPVPAGATFHYTMRARLVSGSAGLLRLRTLERVSPTSTNNWPLATNDLNAANATPGEWVTLSGTRTVAPGRNYMGVQIHFSGAAGAVFEVAYVCMTPVVTGELIAVGAVSASKQVARDTTNLVPDSEMHDAAAWTNSAKFSFQPGDADDNVGNVAVYTYQDTTGTAAAYAGETRPLKNITVEPGRDLFLSVKLKDSLAAEGTVQLKLIYATQTSTSNQIQVAEYKLGQSNSYVTLSGKATVPANTINLSWFFRFQYSAAGAFKGPFRIMRPVMRQMVNSSLLVDGAVATNALAAGAVTATGSFAGADCSMTAGDTKLIHDVYFDIGPAAGASAGSLMGLFTFHMESASGAFGQAGIYINGKEPAYSVYEFGVRAPVGDSETKLPVTIPFAPSGLSGTVRVGCRVTSMPGKDGVCAPFTVRAPKLILWGGKR